MPLKIENIKLAGTKFDGRAKLFQNNAKLFKFWPVRDIVKENWPLCSMLASGLYNLYYLLLFVNTLSNTQQNIGQS